MVSECKEMIAYIDEQVEVMDNVVNLQVDTAERERLNDIEIAAKQLWEQLQTHDWGYFEDDNADMNKMMSELEYTSRIWSLSGPEQLFAPSMFSFKTWEDLSPADPAGVIMDGDKPKSSAQTTIETIDKVVIVEKPDSTTKVVNKKFTQETWDWLYHDQAYGAAARNSLRTKYQDAVKMLLPEAVRKLDESGYFDVDSPLVQQPINDGLWVELKPLLLDDDFTVIFKSELQADDPLQAVGQDTKAEAEKEARDKAETMNWSDFSESIREDARKCIAAVLRKPWKDLKDSQVDCIKSWYIRHRGVVPQSVENNSEVETTGDENDVLSPAEDAEVTQACQDHWFYVSFGGVSQFNRDETYKANESKFADAKRRAVGEKKTESHKLLRSKLDSLVQPSEVKIEEKVDDMLDADESRLNFSSTIKPFRKKAEILRNKMHSLESSDYDDGQLKLRLELEQEHLHLLAELRDCFADKFQQEASVKLFMLPAKQPDELWDSRNKFDTNKHEKVFSTRAFLAQVCRWLSVPVFTVHATERYWLELSVEQRQACIRLGYSADVWDRQVDECATHVWRPMGIARKGEAAAKKTGLNPVLEWYATWPKSYVDGLMAPLESAMGSVGRVLTGDRTKFGFLVQPYRSELFYWELIEYVRKFVLSGLLVYLKPGSLSQLFVACMFSIGFLLLVGKSMPYRDPSSNATKLLSEATLAFILLCTLAMRSNLVGEYLGVDEYAELMIGCTLLGNVVPGLTSMLRAFRLYFETLTHVLEALSDDSTSKVESGSWFIGCLTCAGPKTFLSNLKLIMGKMYSYGVQLTSSLKELDDDMTNGTGVLLAAAMVTTTTTSSENTPQEKTDDDGNVDQSGEMPEMTCPYLYRQTSAAASAQVIKFGVLDQHLYEISEMSKIKHRSLRIAMRKEKNIGTQFLLDIGYTQALWDNDDQPTKALEQNFQKLEGIQTMAKLLGFDDNNWGYYMCDKSYSTAVQDRLDRREYMVQQIQLSSVNNLQQLASDTKVNWKDTNLPELQEDDILEPLTRAWKNVRRESIQQ
jgi:hypothetical protein